MSNHPLLTAAIVSAVIAAIIPAPNQAVAEAVTKSEIAGASPNSPGLFLFREATTYNPAGDPPTWNAVAEAHDSGTVASPTRPVYAGYVKWYDADGYLPLGALLSTDGGSSFVTSSQDGFEASARLTDGRVLAPELTGQTSDSLQQRRMTMRYSTTDGATFGSAVTATVNVAPQSFVASSANFFPNAVVQVPNGPLLMSGYTNLATHGQSALLMESDDAGQSWTLRSPIVLGNATRKFTETAIVLASDGALIAVSRSSDYDNLWKRRSTTLGETWTAAAAPIPEFAPDSAGNRPFGRINPRLALLPNGILALVAGRPDNHVALSYDGTGNSWNVKKVFYDNHSTADPQNLNEGTSGNADLAWTAANRAVLVADSCHAITYQGTHYNKCAWHNAPMSGGTEEFQIKHVLADILTAGTGKIDLARKATLSGDLGAVPGHARTGARGAVDGSHELWSSAFEEGDSGTLDLVLDRPYTLSKVGLSLALGGAQSATVQTKLHAGDAWQDWLSVTDQTGHALKYHSPGARKAQHVRVLTGRASYCPPGVAAPCSVLNELELYSDDVDSFENDAIGGAVPRGYSLDYTVDDNGRGYQGIWVTQTVAGGSSRALLIDDSSTVHLPAIRRSDSSSAVKTLDFRFSPQTWRTAAQGSGSALLFTVLATPVNGTRKSAFHFAAGSDGVIRYYVTATNTWTPVGAGQSFNPSTSTWSTFTVRATTTQATVSVNGSVIGTAPRADSATSNLTGHQFSASSTALANETFLIDDVYTSNS
ncbi:sialidase family protein [Saccharothrix sp. HUAS TT1]|uniref:sialidase family protein n=1 Tax=unclassified Saccharothrix TaxID=2593673 RepID=UPI00345BE5D1